MHPLLHQNCHHQIIFAKVDMKMFYPPPYKRLICVYRNANVEAMNSAITSFNWENTFDGKDVHAQVVFFNETLLNIFSNFKNKIKLRNTSYRQYMRHQMQLAVF